MNNTKIKLRGICPILPTPFDQENQVDVDSLGREGRFLLECGVDGIALFGNASESFALTQEEKEQIARVVVDETGRRVPLIFGAGGTSTETAVVSCRWARDTGADVLMIMPPYMIKPDAQRIYEYYAGIASSMDTPIMIQDAPGACGVSIGIDTILRLTGEFDSIQYVKAEAPPTFQMVKRLVDASEGKFAVFGGLNGTFFYEELRAGAVGSMPAGEFPDVLVQVYRLYAAGDRTQAKRVFYQYLPFIRLGSIPGGSAMSVHKEILKRGGIFTTSNVRGPYVPANDFLKELVDDCVDGLKLKALEWSAERRD